MLTSDTWTSRATEACLPRRRSLKQLFRSAPLLNLPDSNLQFTVKFNTSDVGLEVGLFQCSPRDKKVPPSFFSRNLASPAKRNYDVGNRELLALKLALEKKEKAIARLCPHPCPGTSAAILPNP